MVKIAWNKGLIGKEYKSHYKNGFSGTFKKGHHPSPKTEFKKGNSKPKNAYSFGKSKNNPRWKGGISISDGYISIYLPNHPQANSYGYIRQHRIIMEQKLKRYLKPTEIVHHINGDKKDNRIENLKLFSSNSNHIKEHNKLRRAR